MKYIIPVKQGSIVLENKEDYDELIAQVNDGKLWSFITLAVRHFFKSQNTGAATKDMLENLYATALSNHEELMDLKEAITLLAQNGYETRTRVDNIVAQQQAEDTMYSDEEDDFDFDEDDYAEEESSNALAGLDLNAVKELNKQITGS